MTMIVALHLGAYALVAADKRETYQINGEVVSVVSDDVQKLIEWRGGVATGSGYFPIGWFIQILVALIKLLKSQENVLAVFRQNKQDG